MSTPQQEVADLILAQKASYAIFSSGLMLTVPQIHSIFNKLLVSLGIPEASFVNLSSKLYPTMTIGDSTGNKRIIGGGYKLNITESLNYVEANPLNRISFINNQVISMILTVGDALKANRYFNEDPELELFRHIRNGVAHGNQIKLNPKEPINPAKFEIFEVTRSSHGQTVLGDFMESGDVFHLLDFIEQKLRAGNYVKK